ncbi:MAG: aspartate kinase [Anaerolineae bacterium]|nr:aspartate kinase [Anaerolineae bacterium]
MQTLIMKFGGSSIGMTTGLSQMVRVVMHERERVENLVLVVSALEGVTDSLLDAAQHARMGNRRGYRRNIATLRTRHVAIMDHIRVNDSERAGLQADLDRLLYELLDWCQALADGAPDITVEEALTDAIVGSGERLAARIVAALLRHNQLRAVAVDATDLIISDSVHSHATPDYERSRERVRTVLQPLLDRQILPVVTGFIASDPHDQPTTLGRGGGDLTAAVLATALDANEVWLWTNVDGLMSADPHYYPDARLISRISFAEAADLAYFGTHILHARMVRPLAEREIAIRLRNIYRTRVGGTQIGTAVPRGPAFKSVTGVLGLGLAAPFSGSLHRAAKLVDEGLDELTGSHVEAVLVAQSAGRSVLCFIIPTSAGHEALYGLLQLLPERLDADWEARPVGIVTVAGDMRANQPQVLATALQTLNGLAVLAASPNPSGVSLSIAVEAPDLPDAIERLHALILGAQ